VHSIRAARSGAYGQLTGRRWSVVTSLFISSLEQGLARTGASTPKIEPGERVLSEDPASQAKAAAATRPDALAQITHIARHAITDGISASYMLAGAVMLIVLGWHG
jgi:hypothetical protein